MRIKICGMKYAENICLISKLKPNFMGFIFYKNSSRFFTVVEDVQKNASRESGKRVLGEHPCIESQIIAK